jgi:hypothetical protein
MDYPNHQRLKIPGHTRVENAQDVPAVELPNYRALLERVVYIDVAALDWNGPQHITQRYTEAEFEQLQNSGRTT